VALSQPCRSHLGPGSRVTMSAANMHHHCMPNMYVLVLVMWVICSDNRFMGNSTLMQQRPRQANTPLPSPSA
jgi:hypothetical protein